MTNNIDFTVPLNKGSTTKNHLGKLILYSQTIRRIKANKPCIIGLFGGSGEGKSTAAIRLQQELCQLQGLDFKKYMSSMNVYVPFEFPDKMKKLLFDKELKKCNIIAIHEARDVVNAKDWNSFITKAIAKINTQSRSIKPMIIIIISQYITDLTRDIRRSLTDYITAERGLKSQGFIRWRKTFTDERDPEKPKLRTRKLKGFTFEIINDKPKNYQLFYPDRIYIGLPEKEIIDIFEKEDLAAKMDIIERDLDKVMSQLKKKHGIEETGKIDAMAQYYLQSNDRLSTVGKYYRKRFKLKDSFRVMHELTDSEEQRFIHKIEENIEKRQKITEDDFLDEE